MALFTVGHQRAHAAYSPYVAVVLCQDTLESELVSPMSQMGSMQLVGLAGLAGVPYQTVTLEELINDPAPPYTSIWFSPCVTISDAHMPGLITFLSDYLDNHGTVLLDGPLGIYRADGEEPPYRGHQELAGILDIDIVNWFDTKDYTIQTTDEVHPIAQWSGENAGVELTQGVAEGIYVLTPRDGSGLDARVLLEAVAPDRLTTHPYLSIAEPSGGRVVAISTLGSYTGAATSFRNQPPSGFYDNRLLPYILQAAFWLLAPDDAFVSLQLSHADMTVIGRLDADRSDHGPSATAGFEYINQLGRETGVNTVYGIVSDFANDLGWQAIQAEAEELEAMGSAIASHSHTHPMVMNNLESQGWTAETSDSLTHIRAGLTHAGFAPEVRAFINPGGTIHMRNYANFADSVDLFMTHGFETSVPYGSGLMNWTLSPSAKPLLVINNTPVPDVQWFYDVGWQYTVDEATNLQVAILDYYQRRVGRGVLYNQMLHDYALADMPLLHFPDSGSPRPHFDASGDFFRAEPIYTPSIPEIQDKFHIAQNALYVSAYDPSTQILHVSIDLRGVATSARAHLAGMGLRINHSDRAIVSASVNGAAYWAFADDTLILPPAGETLMIVSIQLGEAPDPFAPRLAYLSKPFATLQRDEQELNIQLRHPGRHTKFCLHASPEDIIVGPDTYAYQGQGRYCGVLNHGSQSANIHTKPMGSPHALRILATERPIVSYAETTTAATFAVGPGSQGTIQLSAEAAPSRVLVDNVEQAVDLAPDGGFSVAFAEADEVGILIIEFAALPPDGNNPGDVDAGPPPAGPDTGDDPVVNQPIRGGCAGCRAGGETAPWGSLIIAAAVALLMRRRRSVANR